MRILLVVVMLVVFGFACYGAGYSLDKLIGDDTSGFVRCLSGFLVIVALGLVCVLIWGLSMFLFPT